MAVVKARDSNQGMLMVGNVGINRIRGDCSDFKNMWAIPQMVYQEYAFEAVQKGYFYHCPREREN